MRWHDLVGADVADADRLGEEADDVDGQLRTGEGADDATEGTGRNVAVPVEQTYGFVQFEPDVCRLGTHNDSTSHDSDAWREELDQLGPVQVAVLDRVVDRVPEILGSYVSTDQP
jgi:hypothetical protein